MPILDGHKVDADQIDPAKHRFIGTWRPPAVPEKYKKGSVDCPCGSELNRHTSGGCLLGRSVFKHWKDGCFDEPQYVTIEGE